MRITYRRAEAALEVFENRPAPKKSSREAVDHFLILNLGIPADAVPPPLKEVLAKAVEYTVAKEEVRFDA